MVAFTPTATFTPTIYLEPFHVFTFSDETLGLIIEARSFKDSTTKLLSVHELDVLIGDQVYCHTYHSSCEPDFRILGENKC